jgi:hypothetical protein
MLDKPAKQIFDEMFEKIKRLEKYEIKREVGPGWLPRGTIPFGIKVKNGIATFTVYAEFMIDAEDQVTTYLENLERDEEE